MPDQDIVDMYQIWTIFWYLLKGMWKIFSEGTVGYALPPEGNSFSHALRELSENINWIKAVPICYICHSLPDLPTNDCPVNNHPSICRPLSPLYSSVTRLGKYLVSHWDFNQAVANFLPKPHSHHQMSLLVMPHPPHAVSHHNPHIKVTPPLS